jgi:hypothetical protein
MKTPTNAWIPPTPPPPTSAGSWWVDTKTREAFSEKLKEQVPRIKLHDRSKVIFKDITE